MKRLIISLLLAGALPAADSSIVPATNAFTSDLYKKVARGDANLILSPFNIATALSMALAGARGQTVEQMRAVLHLENGSASDAALGPLLVGLAKAGNAGDNQLLTTNTLWVQKGFAILPAFEKTLADNFQAHPMPVDFMGHAEAARSEINRLVAERTKEKIPNLLAPGSLNAQTRLVLTSAIYFYGKWQEPFVTSRTRPAPFSLPAGGATQADFMNQTAHFDYAETPSAQILEMRYDGTGMAFDIILPKTVDGLPDVEKSLTGPTLIGWLGGLSDRNVQVSLPKFRAESEFSLGKTLAAMGMPSAFTSQADFSGIDGDRTLAISDVVHKAFVDVSERGTEAAAATGVTMHATAMRIVEPPVVFRADHPFLFLIRDTDSGAVLFIGRLTDPK